jgi:hypothetical protein
MPAPSSRIRRRLTPLAILLLLTAIAALLVVLLNLARFDEPLLPEIAALRQLRVVALEGNGYPLALGFLAAEDRDPHEAGVEIITAMSERRDRGEPARRKCRQSWARRWPTTGSM